MLNTSIVVVAILNVSLLAFLSSFRLDHQLILQTHIHVDAHRQIHSHDKCHFSYTIFVVLCLCVQLLLCFLCCARQVCAVLGRPHYVLGLAITAVRPFIVLSHLGVNNVMVAATCCQLGKATASTRRANEQTISDFQTVYLLL